MTVFTAVAALGAHVQGTVDQAQLDGANGPLIE